MTSAQKCNLLNNREEQIVIINATSEKVVFDVFERIYLDFGKGFGSSECKYGNHVFSCSTVTCTKVGF